MISRFVLCDWSHKTLLQIEEFYVWFWEIAHVGRRLKCLCVVTKMRVFPVNTSALRPDRHWTRRGSFFFSRKRWWLGEGVGALTGRRLANSVLLSSKSEGSGATTKDGGVGGRGWGATWARLRPWDLTIMREAGGVSLSDFRMGAKKTLIAVCCYETYRDRQREETDGKKKLVLVISFFIKSFTIWQKYALCEIKTKEKNQNKQKQLLDASGSDTLTGAKQPCWWNVTVVRDASSLQQCVYIQGPFLSFFCFLKWRTPSSPRLKTGKLN